MSVITDFYIGVAVPNKIKCPKCGHMNVPGKSHCSNCGYKLGQTKEASTVSFMQSMYKTAMACPTAAGDVDLNTKNRDKTIEKHNYGPLNLNDQGYWELIADKWNTTPGVAKKSKCGNCVAFDVSPRMDDCMPGPVSDGEGRLGYCWMHHFKCHSARTCNTWAKGGPIKKDEVSHDWQKKSKGMGKEAFFFSKKQPDPTVGAVKNMGGVNVVYGSPYDVVSEDLGNIHENAILDALEKGHKDPDAHAMKQVRKHPMFSALEKEHGVKYTDMRLGPSGPGTYRLTDAAGGFGKQAEDSSVKSDILKAFKAEGGALGMKALKKHVKAPDVQTRLKDLMEEGRVYKHRHGDFIEKESSAVMPLVVGGGLVGAGLGAVADRDNRLRGAAIGGGLGALGGFAGGKAVDHMVDTDPGVIKARKGAAQAEANLQQTIADGKAQSKKLDADLAEAKKKTARANEATKQVKARLEQVTADERAGKISPMEAVNRRVKILQEMSGIVKEAKGEYDDSHMLSKILMRMSAQSAHLKEKIDAGLVLPSWAEYKLYNAYSSLGSALGTAYPGEYEKEAKMEIDRETPLKDRLGLRASYRPSNELGQGGGIGIGAGVDVDRERRLSVGGTVSPFGDAGMLSADYRLLPGKGVSPTLSLGTDGINFGLSNRGAIDEEEASTLENIKRYLREKGLMRKEASDDPEGSMFLPRKGELNAAGITMSDWRKLKNKYGVSARHLTNEIQQAAGAPDVGKGYAALDAYVGKGAKYLKNHEKQYGYATGDFNKKAAATATKTDPAKWEAAKREAKAKMGGKHSARAMQLATQIYKKKGGGYSGAKPSSKNNSLKKWTKQKWGYSGKDKPGQGGSGVYLPKRRRTALKSTDKGRRMLAAATRRKHSATRQGKQYSSHGLAAGTSLKKSASSSRVKSPDAYYQPQATVLAPPPNPETMGNSALVNQQAGYAQQMQQAQTQQSMLIPPPAGPSLQQNMPVTRPPSAPKLTGM